MVGSSNRKLALDKISAGLNKPTQWKSFVRDCEVKDAELNAKAAEDTAAYHKEVNDLMVKLQKKLDGAGMGFDSVVYERVVSKVKVYPSVCYTGCFNSLL